MQAAPPRARLRQALLNCALVAASMLLFAGILELVLRLVFARSLDFSMEMWKYAVALKQPVPDPRLSFVHRPNSAAFLMGVPFSINSAGLRDREFTRVKPPGVHRIVWLGDSTTLGWGVPLSGTAPKILERELNAMGHGRFEVLNAGVGNYNTVQEVEHYLTIGRAFHPDLVILEYFINDAEPVPRERTAGLLGRSYLAAFAVSRFDGALRVAGLRPRWRDYYASLYRDGSPGLEAATDALGRLAAVTAQDSWEQVAVFRLHLDPDTKKPQSVEILQLGARRDGKSIVLSEPVDSAVFGSPIVTPDGVIGLVQDEQAGTFLPADVVLAARTPADAQ